MASNTVFNPISAPDYLPPERLKELQAARLRQRVSEAYEKVPFFRAKMEEFNVVPGDIQKIEDIAKLPFSVKKDLRDTYSLGSLPSR